MRANGIVVALAAEASTLTPQVLTPKQIAPLANDILACLSGMGACAASQAAQKLVDAGASALAVFGVAGALDSSMRNGNLFCPNYVVDEQGKTYITDTSWHMRLQQSLAQINYSLHANGTLLSTQAPLLSSTEKIAMHHRYQALAVDMESAAVAAIAQQHQLPFLVLRAIVDEVGDHIPSALNQSIDAYGRPLAFKLMTNLCRHPSLLLDLPRLYSRMQGATRALHAAVKAAGSALAWPS